MISAFVAAETANFSSTDAITLGIAAVGAVTGIAALAITVFQYYLSGPRITVEISAALLGPTSRIVGGTTWDSADPETLAAHPLPAIAVHAINRGRMPTMIEQWGVDVGAGMTFRVLDIPGGNPDLPCRIDAGERVTFVADLESVVASNAATSETLGGKRGAVSGKITLGNGRSFTSKSSLTIP